MIHQLISVLHKVIGNDISSDDARELFKNLLSKQEHADLLCHILRFVPNNLETEDMDIEGEIIAGAEESTPSDIFSADCENLHTEEKSIDPEDASLELVQGSPKRKEQQRRCAFLSQRYRRFSEEERAHIMDGVRRFGMGTRNLWRRILCSYRFNNRSSVDIKDAFRTMQRAAWKEKKVIMDQRTPSRRSVLDFTPFPLTHAGPG